MPRLTFALATLLALTASLEVAAQEAVPTFPDDAYVQVKDGHLSLHGERVRYWGWIGMFWLEGKLGENYVQEGDSPEFRAAKTKKAYEVFDALAQRIHDTGFNLVRMWEDVDWSKPYAKGDGSKSDLLAFSFAALENAGSKCGSLP